MRDRYDDEDKFTRSIRIAFEKGQRVRDHQLGSTDGYFNEKYDSHPGFQLSDKPSSKSYDCGYSDGAVLAKYERDSDEFNRQLYAWLQNCGPVPCGGPPMRPRKWEHD